jgi:hypothetical protein
VFENKFLRRIFGPKRDENGVSCTMRSFIIVLIPKYYWADQIKKKENIEGKWLLGKPRHR